MPAWIKIYWHVFLLCPPSGTHHSIYVVIYWLAGRQAGRQAGKLAGRQAGRQEGHQAGSQEGRQSGPVGLPEHRSVMIQRKRG